MTKGNLPSADINNFAKWAVEAAQRDFRAAALNDLQDAINQFPGSPHLTPEEVEFCEGWLYLARKEMEVDQEADLDKALVDKAKRHIIYDQITVMNG
jgi:hypothetical protein